MREGSAVRTASVVFVSHLSVSILQLLLWAQTAYASLLVSPFLSPPFPKFSPPLAEICALRTESATSRHQPYPNTHFTLVFLCSWLFWRRWAVLAAVFLTFSPCSTRSAEIKDEQALIIKHSVLWSCFCRRISIHPSFQALQNKYHQMATALNAADRKLNELVCVCVAPSASLQPEAALCGLFVPPLP